MGCSLRATVDGGELVDVQGQACRRGIDFVREELTAPKRTLTTTVRVVGGILPLAPVRSREPLPKGILLNVAARLRSVELAAPVAAHQVVMADALGSGIDIITTRAIPQAEEAP